MRRAIISEAIGNIDSRFIAEAAEYKPTRLSVWVKLAAVAACILLTVTLGITLFQNGQIGNSDHIVTLDNGDRLRFVEQDTDELHAPSFDSTLDSRKLTGDELGTLFGHLPVSANAHFDRTDHSMIGLEGTIGDVKLMVMADSNAIASGQASEVNGVSISAGYCMTDSDGETVVYYAAFELGGNTVYVEHEGSIDDSEADRTELTAIILMLIDNGDVDLGQITFDGEGFTPPVTIPILPELTITEPSAVTQESPITLPIG